MSNMLHKAWTEMVQPLLRRPRQYQVAALCYRDAGNGAGDEVLLITSRRSGRWILPKGWPIDGLQSHEAAAQEAWEEAGVRAKSDTAIPVGRFDYEKRIEQGYRAPVEAQVFKLRVDALADSYPEASERRRAWFHPLEAADLVKERGLAKILRQM